MDLKIIDIRTVAVEANYDWTSTRIYAGEEATELGEGFLALGLS